MDVLYRIFVNHARFISFHVQMIAETIPHKLKMSKIKDLYL